MRTLIVHTSKQEYRFKAAAFDLAGDVLTVTDDAQTRIAVVRDVTHAYFEDAIEENKKESKKH